MCMSKEEKETRHFLTVMLLSVFLAISDVEVS